MNSGISTEVVASARKKPGPPRRNHLLEIEPEPPRRETRMGRLESALRLMVSIGPVASAPGIYFLLSEDGEVVYVGKSKNVASRMRAHAEKSFRDIRMVRVENENERDKLEILLIGLFNPKYNVVYNLGGPCES